MRSAGRSMAGLVVTALAIALTAGVAAGQARDPAGRRARAARLRAMGQALVASGDPGSAAGYFRDAIAADSRDAASYLALGTVYLDRGSVGDALEVFSAGLRRRPDHAPLYRGLAAALEARGALDEALEALRALISRAPTDLEGHLARAELARRRGAFSEALASYRAVVDLSAGGESVPEARLAEARRYAEALAILVGDVDPVRSATACAVGGSPVRRALARCR